MASELAVEFSSLNETLLPGDPNLDGANAYLADVFGADYDDARRWQAVLISNVRRKKGTTNSHEFPAWLAGQRHLDVLSVTWRAGAFKVTLSN